MSSELPIGFCESTAAPSGKAFERGFLRLGRNAEIKDGIRHGNGLGDRIEYARKIKFLRPRLGHFAPQVKNAGHWQTRLAIRRQMRVPHDVARADDDDGPEV
jgi:hypothetical protein